ncbi:hypothetical protein PBY51_001550 [Eleginops maclovinus]|uniref:Uncharacterized protein n=1 Tax=Eleginops maclovinus TaxID=56733 RepID=A0AAN7WY60_ELEMC|nr:hypothetical protein PBY51_001550 [Eleginops maclovinus]
MKPSGSTVLGCNSDSEAARRLSGQKSSLLVSTLICCVSQCWRAVLTKTGCPLSGTHCVEPLDCRLETLAGCQLGFLAQKTKVWLGKLNEYFLSLRCECSTETDLREGEEERPCAAELYIKISGS